MNRTIYRILNLLIFSSLIYSCKTPQSAKSERLINSKDYSLETKVGQMIIIGLTDNSADSSTKIYMDIKETKIGGIVLYEKNISPTNSKETLKKLVTDLQNISEIPLFIGIDEEGGLVHRLKEKYGFPKMVSAAYLGELNNLDSTKYYGNVVASTLSGLGINLNFAPVVDLAINPANPIIAKVKRSYSSNPKVVTKHAIQTIQSHRAYHVNTVLKHFPGHGSSTSDSHLGMVDVSRTWNKIELQPYKKIIKSGYCDAIMTAHILNSQLEKDSIPATLSKKIMTGILRDKFNYKGVIFSDDMQMHAIAKYYGLENAIKLSINAGVDVLMFSNNIKGSSSRTSEEVKQIILKLIHTGEISEDRIDQSFERIMMLKSKNKK